jgi:hypothetical protein
MKTLSCRRFVVAGLVYFFIARPVLAQMTGTSSNVPGSQMKMKTELFDRDPGWEGVNNRTARQNKARHVRQDFGFSPGTKNTGATSPGEIGGFISPDGHAAFYGKRIDPATFEQPLSASGTLSIGRGKTHLLLGFFNSETVNEWRTPNTIAIRINGRGDTYFAYVEYCTSKWRAGGDSTPFPSVIDPKSKRSRLIGFPCNVSTKWTLKFDPNGNNGAGVIRATIGDKTALCNLSSSHKRDGATFNRFGLINVIKSAVAGSEAWFDDIVVNGQGPETFDRDPNWDGRNNRQTISTTLVRPWFDFGFSNTSFAGGKARGELGGQIFRGDCRYPERMACYGDRVGPLSLDKPLRASGKVAMTRGVTDSTVLFGFYNSMESMHSNPAQSDALPESVIGIHIEGPSRDGFHFYPVLRTKEGRGKHARPSESPTIYPNGRSHDWTFDYDPDAASRRGRITVTLDGKPSVVDLDAGDKTRGTTFDRFGIITPWIDGNSQDVYWDDIAYSVAQE